MMHCSSFSMSSFLNPICTLNHKSQIFHHSNQPSFTFTNPTFPNPKFLRLVCAVGELGQVHNEKPKINKWIDIKPDEINDAQRNHISRLPKNMSNRCKALMKQLICFSTEKYSSLSLLLSAWVTSMKPARADWLVVLKELDIMNHPLRLQVAEFALLEESFEPNIRDYTKIIHGYAKQSQLQDAENTLQAMKNRGFECDQVTLTALIHMYSKAGNFNLAKDTFEEMKLLGLPLDNRAYGSMVMAYIRAGMLEDGEILLREMEAQQIYAKSEVYKAMLRAYSMSGDSVGAQRIFDAIQIAGIIPDDKICTVLINAYVLAGQKEEACVAFENMRRAGILPNDKCVGLMLDVYEKDNKLKEVLDFLMDLEKDGIMIGKEASEKLARWFRDLGVVEEVELVLREYVLKEA
uniref:pentatricopeptide repeat-containing protein At1g01970-like n=1 Tax=Erigeron canadensis TaxID=72917 RepID=UPI001CB92F9E|nr:pentatricopeptide repeat-containing protein At1g01970-like [Erigeron canadensis]XP_043619025.1 pentatricopeptide repeat-containing protein At1g01970-like [Erigeron canadensis]XP_043619026.1 pentatricopeptide repeat-containing protein At1g01970-like [Erigeron canadensis]XP_043619027.1 pentatricopeptide repeat-containing protein At1g01970-like [Erigeron canadensis]XP_043619028.1 pentatricopeptide repeat-containing protein At1g01970-like [Erigeron canadensis]XP_043619029.1 pentatricopeptide re